ncbi:hypothetical protein NBM05_08510 [Rothia sp. AR01]|uniref:Uncharacterized protein n=1 Tax=Rothia santali TaxID=2949643 RepID=A0A9X2HKQ4_9MICC|nr:hypothetical protein [Rothia santali]MCP3426043.1 hypothetical protein [Rothia santali]
MSTNGDDGQPDKADQGEEDWVPEEDQEPDRSITWSKGYPINRLAALLAGRRGIRDVRAKYLAEKIIGESVQALRYGDGKSESVRFVINYNDKVGNKFFVAIRFGKMGELEERDNSRSIPDLLPIDSLVYLSLPEDAKGRPRGASGKMGMRKKRGISGRYSVVDRRNMKTRGRSKRS